MHLLQKASPPILDYEPRLRDEGHWNTVEETPEADDRCARSLRVQPSTNLEDFCSQLK